MVADFSGYATKAGLKCSDGRTIMPEAFQHMDGKKVPLVWQHGHNEPANVLGHTLLEKRDDGVYAYAFFNDTPSAQNAKRLVQHGDIVSLSIYANQLVEKGKQVFHGMIREVSLVLSGANPGALIDNVTIAHSDGDETTLEDEAIVYTGLPLEHEDKSDDDSVEHADDDKTVKDVYDSLSEEQKNVVHYMIGQALEAVKEEAAEHSSDQTTDNSSDSTTEDTLNHKEGTDMTRNVFEQQGGAGSGQAHTLSHDDIKSIVANAEKSGSLKHAVEAYALEHGITDIDVLFPDAKNVQDRPEFDQRRMEWVAGVLNGTKHTPFSRIKTRVADITPDSARALGYIKGNLKKEEFFGLTRRVTTPTTIYKKQKLDRDDIIDITDFDVVAWLKAEMRVMLEEELARAVLIGDGRPVEDPAAPGNPNPDKISEENIRPIAKEHELYATHLWVDTAAVGFDYNDLVETVLLNRRFYKGSGQPTFFTTEETLTRMLLSKDNNGQRNYKTEAELAAALRVDKIVAVEVMEGSGYLGILVNLRDYVIGADRGGDVSMFDDFDIDYNQYKYLIETRCSGALTKLKSAMVIHQGVEPATP